MTEPDRSTKWILWSRPEPEPKPAAPSRTSSLWERTDEQPTPANGRAPAAAAAPGPPPGHAAPPAAAPAPVAPLARPVADIATGVRSHHLSEAVLPPEEYELIRRIVDERSVQIEFEAIRDTLRDQVVGFEALARGPQGPLRSPLKLFAAAHAAGLAGQLDWICRAEAFRQMLAANLPPAVSLVVNVEPESLIEPCPDDLLNTIWEASARLRVFVDITGRALSRYPFEVLETVRRARAAGWGVAVGDIEFSASGLALLPTLEPDVLKVSHNVLTVGHGYASAAVTAVLSEMEHTGAALLVERVEDEQERRASRAIGAGFHSGRLFGEGGPLPPSLTGPLAPLPLRATRQPTGITPWQVLSHQGTPVVYGVTPDEADNLARILAMQAAGGVNPPPVVALVLPDGGAMSGQSSISYRMLLERCPLLLVLGRDVGAFRDWRARAAELPAGHPLLNEMCFVALSPNQSMVLSVRPNDSTPGTVDLLVSQNPTACREVMRHLADTMDTLAGGVRHGVG